MNAGKLRDLVTVQENKGTQNSQGEVISSWSDVLTDYAEVRRMGGREYFSQARVEADVDTHVLMRYRAEIKAKHRIKFESTYFDIQSVIPDQRKTQVELFCKEAAE